MAKEIHAFWTTANVGTMNGCRCSNYGKLASSYPKTCRHCGAIMDADPKSRNYGDEYKRRSQTWM